MRHSKVEIARRKGDTARLSRYGANGAAVANRIKAAKKAAEEAAELVEREKVFAAFRVFDAERNEKERKFDREQAGEHVLPPSNID